MTQVDATVNARASGRSLLAPAITLGFAMAVVMWVVGYVLHLPGVRAPGVVTGPILLAIMAAGGVLAGRCSPAGRAWLVGAGAGVVTGLLNLMILGSILLTGDEDAGAPRPSIAIWITGWLGFSALVGALFAAVSRRVPLSLDLTASTARWLGRFAIVTVLAVLALLAIGGAVTSTETGMAVPDWPNTFGTNMFLYPLSRMTGGIYLEHAHRLFGALVGLTTLAAMIFTFAADRRRGVWGLAIAAFALVCVQGVLGGLRVELDESLGLFFRMFHGFTAHIIIGLIALLAASVSMTWRKGKPPRSVEGAGKTRLLSALFLIVLLVQVALGVAARHTDSSLHGVISHSTFSIVALIFAIAAGAQARAAHGDIPLFRRIGTGVMHGAGAQMLLGAAALWAVLTNRADDPLFEVMLTTAHQVVGAALVVLAVLLTAWTRRLLAPPSTA